MEVLSPDFYLEKPDLQVCGMLRIFKNQQCSDSETNNLWHCKYMHRKRSE